MKLLPRSEVPVEETWDLSHLYPSDEAWEKDLERIPALIDRVKGFQGKLSTASALLNLLKAMEELMETFSRVAAYPSLQQATDGTHPAYQAQTMKVNLKGQEMQAALSFVEPELLALPEETWERFLREEPNLEAYRPYIRRLLRRKPHVLSEEGERILGSLSAALAAPSTIYQRASAADLSFPPVEHQSQKIPLTVSRYDQYLASPDRALRQKAHAALGEGLKGLQTTLATTLALHIQKNVAVARLRGYPSAEAMFLHPQDIPMEVYENVLDGIHEEMAPAVRRWVDLRKKVLGLPEVHTYDLFTPLYPESEPQVTFAEAKEMILSALKPLGHDYLEIVRRAFDERWIDRAENEGKRHGAFCSTVYGVHSYIFMTWRGRLRNVFTLAHELGHACHGMLAGQHQSILQIRSGLFFVEAPSTGHEVFLGNDLLSKEKDPLRRIHIIQAFMGTFIHNMVTHLLQGHLERRLYRLAEKGVPITLSTIRQEQRAVYEGFFGDAVVIDDVDELAWMTVPHYYTGLYPYTYAAGLSCGVAVARRVLTEGTSAAEDWLAALKMGGTAFPLELMDRAGVNLRDPEILREGAREFGKLVNELEELLTGLG